MKKRYFTLLLAVSLSAMSCEDLLNLNCKDSVTHDYLLTEEGVQREAAALYSMDRSAAVANLGRVYMIDKFDAQTDISLFRTGEGGNMFKMGGLTPMTAEFEFFWNHYYSLIGKANEIIASAEELNLEPAAVKRAWGEAKFFRGRCYFELYKRFERLYLNTVATNIGNIDREYAPASKEDVFTQIRTDLDDAIDALDWELPAGVSDVQYGRANKAVAKHVRAQVALWEKDYAKVIEECEDIFAPGHPNHMDESLEAVFLSSEDLRSPEILMAYQFSKNLGGGGTNQGGGNIAGHKMSCVSTAFYTKITGCIPESKYGGFGWGRVFPNTYLLSLYDQEKDNRYKNMFTHKYYYNDPSSPKFGQEINPKDYVKNGQYCMALHVACKKNFDCWTNADQPDRLTGFKDLVLYRMGETAIMLAEAYLQAGDMSNACKYYNMTWERAGNDPVSVISMQDIIDEYARECNFEGVRWSVLKRLGILADAVNMHGGDSKTEDPYLDINYATQRKNFQKGKHEVWPIPMNQIDLMGGEDVFPQNEQWR